MKSTTAVLTIVLVMTVSVPVLADWDVGDPYKMHFPQLPDLEMGMNVLATQPKILADDFLCIATGPITDIHIWGSWLNDIFPVDQAGASDPGAVDFVLSIWTDIPVGPEIPYSRPGELLWEHRFLAGTFTHRPWDVSKQRFFDPNLNEVIGFDTQVIQYNFHVPDPFIQREGIIYWLGVTAIPHDPETLFGWKTSPDHWNDDSVFADYVPGVIYNWRELIDPDEGFSLDQAFVIVPEPTTMALLGLAGMYTLLRRRR